jgi:hypothetical protein
MNWRRTGHRREKEHRNRGMHREQENTRVKHRPASQLLDKLRDSARLEISHGPDRNAKSTEEREKRHHHYQL